MVTAPARTRVVVVGAGFAGLNVVASLRGAPVDVTLVDQRNFHTFQPLLYQVATAALDAARSAFGRLASTAQKPIGTSSSGS